VDRVAIQTDGMRRLVLGGPMLAKPPYVVDLRDQATASWLEAPFQTLLGGEGRSVRAMANPRFRRADFVEIVVRDAELKRELVSYLWKLILVGAFVAAFAGLLVYLSLNLFLVRPMQRITRSMERFRADPEDAEARVQLSGRRDEIGRAERELDLMQGDLRAALNSRARLAALGEAVAKINHDLKNMLTSAQIASERLAQSGDPFVAAALPRLERALDRAAALASNVLEYGKSEERPPEPAVIPLLAAVEAAGDDAGLLRAGVKVNARLEAEDAALADPEQIHRVLVNLLRNAREAIQASRPDGGGAILVSASYGEGRVTLQVADNGPGLPPKVLANLFQPFTGSGRPEGTGLGLAISRELAQANGGDLVLARTGDDGAVFELTLPAG
jgi:signal transduction histidine kinase